MIHEHPDANLLAAFAEKRLLPHEREQLLTHLAECADCREIVALASAPAQRVPVRPVSLVWRWAAAAAAAALIWMGAWGLRLIFQSPQQRNTGPLVAMTAKSDTLNSPETKLTPQLEIAPAPPTSRAAPPPRKRLKAFLPSPQPRPPIVAPKYFPAPMAKGLAVTANSGFLPRTRVLWSVAAPVIQRSSDGGITWQPVSISEGAEFHAVASYGSEVWTGGSHGVLFHSSDAGANWKRIEVSEGDKELTGSIVTIRLPEPSEVILETDSGQQWISRDGGTSWQHL
jgi:hypothetical protein